MAFALIDSVSVGSTGGGTVTSAAIDTTGADLLVLALSWYDAEAAPTISDSETNTWTALTARDGNHSGAAVQFYYVAATRFLLTAQVTSDQLQSWRLAGPLRHLPSTCRTAPQPHRRPRFSPAASPPAKITSWSCVLLVRPKPSRRRLETRLQKRRTLNTRVAITWGLRCPTKFKLVPGRKTPPGRSAQRRRGQPLLRPSNQMAVVAAASSHKQVITTNT
jgi:hypothetical protein